jgi:hypothetical protein
MTTYQKIPNVYLREVGGKRLIDGAYASEELEALAGIQWLCFEKIDGTNIRVIWDGYRVSFAGRTDKSQIPTELQEVLEKTFGTPEAEEMFESLFGEKQVILFGEGYGGKIQGNNEYGETKFILFDVMVDGLYLKTAASREIAVTLGIKHVPLVFKGTLPECVEYVKAPHMSVCGDLLAEGVVCRPAHARLYDHEGHRIMCKIKYRDFKGEA